MSIVASPPRRVHADALSVEQYEAFRALVDAAAPPPLPGLADVETAAGAIRSAASVFALSDQVQACNRRLMLTLSPGTVQLRAAVVRWSDVADPDDVLADDPVVQALGAASRRSNVQGELPIELVEKPGRAAVSEWSAKSRARMFQTIPGLDFSGWGTDRGTLAMVTLTLPGWWEVAAPTGAAFKGLVRAFQQRWVRAIGAGSWVGLWKLEFQRRGAPHLHALMRVPALVHGLPFETWLSRTWADVVRDSLSDRDRAAYMAMGEYDRHVEAGTGVDYSGHKFSDPRRISVYFLGHSSKHTDGKEYQHVVPRIWRGEGAGPGRFWGYWGLAKAAVTVQLTQADFHDVARVARKVARARAWRQAVDRARWRDRDGEQRPFPLPLSAAIRLAGPVRRLRSFGHAGGTSGGTVVVNDAVALGYDIARFLASREGLRG